MLKQALFSTLIALAVVIFATQAVATTVYEVYDHIGGTAWDGEEQFLGSGLTVFTGYGNSAQHNPDDIYSNPALYPGYVTINGNPGGSFSAGSGGLGVTKAGGWTIEFRLNILSAGQPWHNTGAHPGMATVLAIADDTDLMGIRMRRGTSSAGGLPTFGLFPNNIGEFDINSDLPNPLKTAVDFFSGGLASENNRQFHTFRLVRQPGSAEINMYVDDFVKEDGSGAETITVHPCVLPACDGGNLNVAQFITDSKIESAIDYFRWHHGASAPVHIPEPATLGLLGLGGVALLRRRR